MLQRWDNGWENVEITTSSKVREWQSVHDHFQNLTFRRWIILEKVDLRKFSEKQITAIAYLSQPYKAGLTYEEIAERCGISVRQLYRWRQDPEFQAAVVQESLKNVKEVMPNVLKAHVKKAEAGNVKAIELFYRLFGLLIEKQEVEQTITTTKDKSNDELQKELDELKKLLDESSSD